MFNTNFFLTGTTKKRAAHHPRTQLSVLLQTSKSTPFMAKGPFDSYLPPLGGAVSPYQSLASLSTCHLAQQTQRYLRDFQITKTL